MTDFDEFLNEQMKDPEFKAEWDALDPEFAEIEAENLNRETVSALDEYTEMQQNPEKYKRYASFQEAMADTLDPFYSEQNTARLRKSIAEMENTGGTVHDVSFLTDSLTGILPEGGDADTARREALARKYDLK